MKCIFVNNGEGYNIVYKEIHIHIRPDDGKKGSEKDVRRGGGRERGRVKERE